GRVELAGAGEGVESVRLGRPVDLARSRGHRSTRSNEPICPKRRAIEGFILAGRGRRQRRRVFRVAQRSSSPPGLRRSGGGKGRGRCGLRGRRSGGTSAPPGGGCGEGYGRPCVVAAGGNGAGCGGVPKGRRRSSGASDPRASARSASFTFSNDSRARTPPDRTGRCVGFGAPSP